MRIILAFPVVLFIFLNQTFAEPPVNASSSSVASTNGVQIPIVEKQNKPETIVVPPNPSTTVNVDESPQSPDVSSSLQPPNSRRFRRPFRRPFGQRRPFQRQWQQQQRQRQQQPLSNPSPVYADPRALNAFLAAAALILQSQQQQQQLYNQRLTNDLKNLKNVPSSGNSITSSPSGNFPFPPLGSQASLFTPNHSPPQQSQSQQSSLFSNSQNTHSSSSNANNNGQQFFSNSNSNRFNNPKPFSDNNYDSKNNYIDNFQPFDGESGSSSSGSWNPIHSNQFGKNQELQDYSSFQNGDSEFSNSGRSNNNNNRFNSNNNNYYRNSNRFQSNSNFPKSSTFQQNSQQDSGRNSFFNNQYSDNDYQLDIAKSQYRPSLSHPQKSSQKYSSPSSSNNNLISSSQFSKSKPHYSDFDSSNNENIPEGFYDNSISNVENNYSPSPQLSYDVQISSSTKTLPPIHPTIQYITPSPHKPYSFTFEPSSNLINPDLYNTNQLLAQSEAYFKQLNHLKGGLSPEQFLKSYSASSVQPVLTASSYSSPKLNIPPPLSLNNEAELTSFLNFEPYLKSGALPPDSIFPTALDTSKYFLPAVLPPPPETLQQYLPQFSQQQATSYNDLSSLPVKQNLEPEQSAYYSTSSSLNPPASNNDAYRQKQYPQKQFQSSSSASSSSQYYDLDNPFSDFTDSNDLLANPSSSNAINNNNLIIAKPTGTPENSNNVIYSSSGSDVSSSFTTGGLPMNLKVSNPVIFYRQEKPKSKLGNLISNIQENFSKLLS